MLQPLVDYVEYVYFHLFFYNAWAGGNEKSDRFCVYLDSMEQRRGELLNQLILILSLSSLVKNGFRDVEYSQLALLLLAQGRNALGNKRGHFVLGPGIQQLVVKVDEEQSAMSQVWKKHAFINGKGD